MGNIINHFADGAIRMEAGSTLNGDVHIRGTFYQGSDLQEAKEPRGTNVATNDSAFPLNKEENKISAENSKTRENEREIFHFVHPCLEDEEAWKVHREVERLVGRFGIQEICEYLSQLKAQKKLLLPQNVKVAHEELARMGMPVGKDGFDYKTFAKYYNKE
nr:hypothetical protein [uncultured Prevotella sp.]